MLRYWWMLLLGLLGYIAGWVIFFPKEGSSL